jgi:uncharacterized membrane protein
MHTDKSIAARFMARFKHRHMTRVSYLVALRTALAGAPADVAEQAYNDTDRLFAEGAAAGRSEAEIAQALPDPRKAAAQAKAAASGAAFAQTKSVPNLWRLFIALLGLAIFNLFMVIPAIVFTAFLTAFYAVAFACYVAGIAVTASGVSGVDDVVFDRDSPVAIHGAGPQSAHIELTEDHLSVMPQADPDRGIRFSADIDSIGRGERTAGGIGLIGGGILLLLLCVVVTKYALIGLKRYAVMNWRLLANA